MFEDDLFHPNNVDDVVLDNVRRNAKSPGIGGGGGGQKTHECQVPGYDAKGKKAMIKCYTSSGLMFQSLHNYIIITLSMCHFSPLPLPP